MQLPQVGQLKAGTPASLRDAGDRAATTEQFRRYFRRGNNSRDVSPETDEQATPAAPLPGEESRFRAGSLSPVDEATIAGRESRSAGWRIFDRALLLAEFAGALVITWVVAQYIYTVYIDTTPHHLSAPGYRPPARTAAGSQSLARHTPTSTPETVGMAVTTRVALATPAPQAPVATEYWGAGGPVPPLPPDTPTTTPSPTATVDPALLLPVRLRIPVMFLDSPVHEVKLNMGTWEVAPMDIGHHEGTANPGETGNMVLAGHRDINSALFRELDRLKPGDEVFVSNSFREYRYVVTDSAVVTPDHTEVMDPTDDKRVTLITCTPLGIDTQRLIVTAILDETPGTP